LQSFYSYCSIDLRNHLVRARFSLSFSAVLVGEVSISSAQEQAPAPAFKEGDTWQYNFSRQGGLTQSSEFLQGTYEITITQGNVKAYEVNGNEKREIAIRSDGPSESLLTLIGKAEDRPNLKFPLSVGQKWNYQYRTQPPGAKNPQTRSVEVSVIGIEQVTTPAGSFKGYKLMNESSWSTKSGRGGNTTTSFYSPETRSIVKRSNKGERDAQATSETELVKFTPGN
jgi:hypothetical protein